MNRYHQMLALIDRIKPDTIVEIGVHRATRAVMLCDRALRWSSVAYMGFDVFETMPQAFQDAAMNGKGMPTQADATRALRALARRHTRRFAFDLVVGDTRETLHFRTIDAPFVFIDGDHRVDAIRGDFAAVAGSGCVVFDDYYVPDAGGSLPIDLAKFGANAVVDALARAGRRVEILPAEDDCRHGGRIKLAVVWGA